MGYAFEEELKKELVELGIAKQKVDDAKKEYEEMRNRVQKWAEVNNLTSYEVADEEGQEWQIKFEPRQNRRIRDWKLIREALGDDFQDYVNEYESSVFKVGRKTQKKQKK